LNGFLSIDKPVGPSSYAVVHAVKKAFSERRVGHAGTLDPAASGVLVVALGNATRLLPYLPLEPKAYEFGICFGIETDTLDAVGSVVKKDGPIPSQAGLEAVLKEFRGMIQQKPPVFSAIKVDGERAYKKARRDEPVEMKERPVQIFSIDLLSFEAAGTVVTLRASCSGGTYVRSLARDIALRLGTFGHASSIRRTGVGPFTIERSIPFSAMAASGASSIISIRDAFSGFPAIQASEIQKKALSYGQSITIDSAPATDLPVLIFNDKDELLALVEKAGQDTYKPLRVFIGK
jgi:tRNA pseudouridine55 synthase